MKIPPFTLVLLGLPAQVVLAAFRPDIRGRVEVAELDPDQLVTEDATEVEMRSSPRSDFIVLFKCTKDDKKIAISADSHFVGCCLPGQHLSGSEQSGFDCCGQGHEFAGDTGVGYTCCPTGFMYDGTVCKADPGYNGGGGHQQQQLLHQHQQQQQQQGSNGGSSAEGQQQQQQQNDNDDGYRRKIKGNGDQQQQQQQHDDNDLGYGHGYGEGGQQQQQQQQDDNDRGYRHGYGEDGGQQQQQQQRGGGGGRGRGKCGIKKTCANGKRLVNDECVCPKGQVEGSDGCCRPCTSGIETGKCYTFKYDNGYLLGWNILNYYGPGPESRNQRSGLFKLCKTEECTPGLPVNPADGIRIKDMHGLPNTGANPGEWLNNAQNGAHITKTPDYAQAGVFTLTKWPCGKYCLGGLDAGVGPTCPADVVGSTFTTLDKESCTPIELMEVPCDSHAKENNCTWKEGDQCCNKVDCGTKH